MIEFYQNHANVKEASPLASGNSKKEQAQSSEMGEGAALALITASCDCTTCWFIAAVFNGTAPPASYQPT